MGGSHGSWRGQGDGVRVGLGPPIAVVEPDRLYLPVAGSQLPVGGLPGGPAANVPTPFSELTRGLAGTSSYSLGLDELCNRGPDPEARFSATAEITWPM